MEPTEEIEEPFRALGLQQHIAYVLSLSADVSIMQHDEAASGVFYKESLALFRQVKDKDGLAYCLQRSGGMAARQGANVWAVRLWGAAETLLDVDGLRTPFLFIIELTDYEQADYERMVSFVRAQLGERAFATSWAEGRNMTPEQALAQQGLEIAAKPANPTPQSPLTTTPASVYPVGLTAREVQVLRLVAQGLTNNEIAE
jgi:hypothetical protein